jgi:hypothetical protein
VQAKYKELRQLFDLDCDHRMMRRQAKNLIDVRWVTTWKRYNEDEAWIIKARMTLRGFKDSWQDLETYAGTASRWSQRFLPMISVLHPGFDIWNLDVSGAFAKGLTWEELSKATGDPLRAVQFEITNPQDVQILRTMPGFEDFDPATECLSADKAIYGLQDAPKAWRLRLHQIMEKDKYKQLLSEAQTYVYHAPSPTPSGGSSGPRNQLRV